MSRVRLLSVLLVLGAATAALAGNAVGESHGASHAKAVDLGAELKGLVAMPGGPPGAIAIVQRGGSTSVYRAGVSNIRSGTPLGVGQHMRIASVSKAFSAAVALALVDRRMLALSDTIGRWLPQLTKKWHGITLAELLKHTSGLPDFTESTGFAEYLMHDDNLHSTPPPRFLLTFVENEKLRFTPGTRYQYSNTDNIVVGLMAEAASHREYNSLLSSLVYSPLHMHQTTLPKGTEISSPFMHGYMLDPPREPTDVTTFFSAALSWASGGIVSTPADLNRFVRGYVGARLFSRKVQSRQLQVVRGSSGPPGPGENFAGLGIFRYRTRCGSVYGHTGNIPGWTQFTASTLDGKRSVVVSVNGQISEQSKQPMLDAWRRLRQIEGDAVCAAVS
jgi:D-alanyl-D-alanine carboxypeptidase